MSCSMIQTTGKFRDTKDQYYTKPEIAKLCVDILKKHATVDVPWIEPSAGKGVFLDYVSHAIGYDIDPKDPRITKADFLQVDVPRHSVVFGNPPFGRQSSIAKQFIRHSTKTCDVVGFILPRSFQKPSMQKAFPLTFHLEEEIELPKLSFLVNDVDYDVPCVFQVWKRKNSERQIETPILPEGFAFVKSSDPYDFAFRRVGIHAGRCSAPGNHSPQSHYFIKLENPKHTQLILQRSQTHVFPSNTTGPRSLTKSEATVFLRSCISSTSF